MKTFISKNWLGLLLVIGVIFVIIFLNKPNINNESAKSFLGVNISSATQITCTYPQVLMAVYSNNEIQHSLPEPETHPMIFTFSNVNNPEVGQLSYIDSTQTITNVSLIKLIDDNERLIYLEGAGTTYITMHTIFKQTGVATYAKSINFLGQIPEIASAMGSCVGY